MLVLAGAGGSRRRDDLLDTSAVLSSQLDLKRAKRLGELRSRTRTDERHDMRPSRQHPGDGQLRGRDALLAGHGLERVDDLLVACAVLTREARQTGTEIVRR
jgi:hypothetical protein